MNKMAFSVTANQNNAIGDLKLDYNNLKISVGKFNNKELSEDKSLEWLVNLLINSILIKKDNPTRKKELRVGKIDFERDKTRFVVHYWLNSLFTGIPTSLGISTKIQEKVKK
jgi:hypothetical protein